MLVEKLLLHVLIVISPILFYSALLEKRQIPRSSYYLICGVLNGIAASLCMIFSYVGYGLYWDLRTVPLVLATLYSSRIAGGIVVLFILGTRTYLGGDAFVFGNITCLLAWIIPFFAQPRFMQLPDRKRTYAAVLISVWPSLIMFAIFLIYLTARQIPLEGSFTFVIEILWFAAVQMVAVGFGSLLIEGIMERIQMKQEIQRAEKWNTLGQLAASIAHEVRNPLTVVKGFLQFMQKDASERNRQYYPIVLDELQRAEEIINDYLNFSKPQMLKPERLLLHELVSSIIMLLNPLSAQQGVELHSSGSGEIPVLADRHQLQQAIVNLMKNAIEATQEGGSVTVRFASVDGRAELTIADTGKGMTKEQISRIGTLFYTTKDKGTGLGTMVSLRIIETLKGYVTYKSEVGAGTEVTVSLPLVQ